MAATELAVTAQTYSFSTYPVLEGGRCNTHSARQYWTKVHAGPRNATSNIHTTQVTLHRLPGAARYDKGELPTPDEAQVLLESVGRLVEDAAMRLGTSCRLKSRTSSQTSNRPQPHGLGVLTGLVAEADGIRRTAVRCASTATVSPPQTDRSAGGIQRPCGVRCPPSPDRPRSSPTNSHAPTPRSRRPATSPAAV